MITINDVISGVSNKLDERFPHIPIRGEEIKQELKPPCFFVKLFPVSQVRELGRRYKRYHSFDIQYFPATLDANDEMHDIAESLYGCMEYIVVNGGKVRGHNTRHEIIAGTLHFFIDYDFHVMRSKPSELTMRTLEQEGNVK